MNNLDADGVISYVNKIIENVRCATCDRLEGSRLRYSCGHTACDECIVYTLDCPTCTSQLPRSYHPPKPDYVLTQTVKNATTLLRASQNLFGASAFHRKRISEQLKIEKELFPKCIQAPIKYENKRKSTNISFDNKENRSSTVFPGEATSSLKESKMENSTNYVQQWLNKNNLVRKPFADINVNKQNVQSPKSIKTVERENRYLQTERKRSYSKTTEKNNYQLGGNKKAACEEDSAPKKAKIESHVNQPTSSEQSQKKCDNDESGIFMDNDPIVIDDSQQSVVDKDKLAWLAVIEACKNEELGSTSNSRLNSSTLDYNIDTTKQRIASNVFEVERENTQKRIFTKVPFFKKSAIIETCKYCKIEVNLVKPVPAKPVTITVDSESFLTTITVINNVQSNLVTNRTCSVSIQTDLTSKTTSLDHDMGIHELNENTRHILLDNDARSIELFPDDKKIFEDECQRTQNKCIVIAESDSDNDSEHLEVSGQISVKADVHRSYDESGNGILTEIINVRDRDINPHRGPRGVTPTSTDSSEKENYSPNKHKKKYTGKKKSAKK